MDESEKDWKLKLRYGTISTPYKHFTVIAKGIVSDLVEGFECRNGSAVMGMKIWAETIEESADVFQSIGAQIGFEVTGDMQIFETEPTEPPGEDRCGYDINFTPFHDN
jgi:hypothetical protein